MVTNFERCQVEDSPEAGDTERFDDFLADGLLRHRVALDDLVKVEFVKYRVR